MLIEPRTVRFGLTVVKLPEICAVLPSMPVAVPFQEYVLLKPRASATVHEVLSADRVPATCLPSGLVSVSDAIVPSATVTETGSPGLPPPPRPPAAQARPSAS